MTENLDRLRKLLAYYGNLDKTTVLSLIDRAEAAEAAIQRVREVMSDWDTDEDAKGLHFDLERALDGGEQE